MKRKRRKYETNDRDFINAIRDVLDLDPLPRGRAPRRRPDVFRQFNRKIAAYFADQETKQNTAADRAA